MCLNRQQADATSEGTAIARESDGFVAEPAIVRLAVDRSGGLSCQRRFNGLRISAPAQRAYGHWRPMGRQRNCDHRSAR